MNFDLARTCWRYYRRSSVHVRFPTTLIVTSAYETNRIEFSNSNLVITMQKSIYRDYIHEGKQGASIFASKRSADGDFLELVPAF